MKIKGNENYEFYSTQLQCYSFLIHPNPTQPITCAGKCDPTQPTDGPNPCPSGLGGISPNQTRQPSLLVAAIIDKVKDTRDPVYRPPLPVLESEGIQPGVETLMKQCWAEEPAERPAFDAVLKSLKVINKGKSAFLILYLGYFKLF